MNAILRLGCFWNPVFAHKDVVADWNPPTADYIRKLKNGLTAFLRRLVGIRSAGAVLAGVVCRIGADTVRNGVKVASSAACIDAFSLLLVQVVLIRMKHCSF